MKYLILMFFKYYRRGKQTKNIAYFSSITAVILYLHIVFFSLMSLLKIDYILNHKNKAELYLLSFYLYCITIIYYIHDIKKDHLYRNMNMKEFKKIIKKNSLDDLDITN